MNVYVYVNVNINVNLEVDMMTILSVEELKRKIMEDHELLKKTIKENPALLDYIFSDAEIRRKYVKIPAEEETKLRQAAHDAGLAEGALIGLGIALLLWILFGGKK